MGFVKSLMQITQVNKQECELLRSVTLIFQGFRFMWVKGMYMEKMTDWDFRNRPEEKVVWFEFETSPWDLSLRSVEGQRKN